MSEQKMRYLSAQRKNFAQIGVNVEYGVVHHDCPVHTHDFYEAFVFVSGSATHVVGDWEYPLSRGDMFVIKGDEAHGFRDIRDMEIINLMYDSRFLQQFYTELFPIPGFSSLFLVEPQIRLHQKHPASLQLSDSALEHIVHTAKFLCGQQENPASYPVLRLNFLALLSYLASQYDVHSDSNQPVYIIAQAVEYMKAHLAQPVRLQELADSVFLSSRQLERIFLKYYGTSPMGYLRELRLKNAFTLLTEQDVSIGDAAEQSGFSDISYFIRLFHEAYGMTPGTVQKYFAGQHAADPLSPEA